MKASFRYELYNFRGELMDRATDLRVAQRRAEDLVLALHIVHSVKVHEDGVPFASFSEKGARWTYHREAA